MPSNTEDSTVKTLHRAAKSSLGEAENKDLEKHMFSIYLLAYLGKQSWVCSQQNTE